MPDWRRMSFLKSYQFSVKFKTKVICGKGMEMLDLLCIPEQI
jgi:hypothetical protein